MKDSNKPREERTWSKISYGFADIYGGGAFVVISTFFTVFLTKALGMPAALAGTIPLIGKFWDAVNDPIMGGLADRTSSMSSCTCCFQQVLRWSWSHTTAYYLT